MSMQAVVVLPLALHRGVLETGMNMKRKEQDDLGWLYTAAGRTCSSNGWHCAFR
jgi:hypothetical protein